MRKKQYKPSNHRGLQVITLCISTAMVLILLGLVIFSVLMGRNLSSYVKENLVVQVMLEQDMTNPEGLQMCKRLKARPYVKGLTYISKEQALKEATHDLGTNPSEFAGVNPFQPSIEITTQADYANNDSLKWIAKELKGYSRVTEVSYQHDLIEQVNNSLTKISIGLAYRSRPAYLYLVLADQQYGATGHLCPPILHPYDEAGRCILGLYPQAFPQEG